MESKKKRLSFLKKQKENSVVRVSTRIMGKAKDKFIDYCIDREEEQGVILREIIVRHFETKTHMNF